MLTVVGACAALWIMAYVLGSSFSLTGDLSHDYNVEHAVSSPERDYVATTYIDSGGGAAGWCYKLVSVHKKDERYREESEERVDELHVFSVRCSAEIEVKWLDTRKLQISYLNNGSLYLHQKKWSKDSAVSVSYVAN